MRRKYPRYIYRAGVSQAYTLVHLKGSLICRCCNCGQNPDLGSSRGGVHGSLHFGGAAPVYSNHIFRFLFPRGCSRVSSICRSCTWATTRSRFFPRGGVRRSLHFAGIEPVQQPDLNSSRRSVHGSHRVADAAPVLQPDLDSFRGGVCGSHRVADDVPVKQPETQLCPAHKPSTAVHYLGPSETCQTVTTTTTVAAPTTSTPAAVDGLAIVVAVIVPVCCVVAIAVSALMRYICESRTW